MERINRINLTGKTPEEALPEIAKWMNEVADKLNYELSHLDNKNFSEDKQPAMRNEVSEMLAEQWEQVKKLVARNKGE